eukprot:COSAG02_NODE_90_length_37755_cov_29.833364_20_plen_105_part_00
MASYVLEALVESKILERVALHCIDFGLIYIVVCNDRCAKRVVLQSIWRHQSANDAVKQRRLIINLPHSIDRSTQADEDTSRSSATHDSPPEYPDRDAAVGTHAS